MGIVRRGDNDETNFWNSEEFIKRAYDADIGILCGGLVAAALQNRDEAKSRHARDHLRVKRTPSKPKSYETYIHHKKCFERASESIKKESQKPSRGAEPLLSNTSEKALHTIASLNGNS